MKTVFTGMFVLALAVLSAQPQMGGTPQTITLAQGMQRSYDGVKLNLTAKAEKL